MRRPDTGARPHPSVQNTIFRFAENGPLRRPLIEWQLEDALEAPRPARRPRDVRTSPGNHGMEYVVEGARIIGYHVRGREQDDDVDACQVRRAVACDESVERKFPHR